MDRLRAGRSVPGLPAHLRYRGGPASLDISIGLAQLGDSQLELIQPHGDGPSVYRDTVPHGQPGLHHIGRFTDDLDVELERRRAAGDLVAVEGAPTELLRFAYVNTRASIGCMTEYFEWAGAEPLRALFEAVADAAHNWDGSDPIRRLPGLTG